MVRNCYTCNLTCSPRPCSVPLYDQGSAVGRAVGYGAFASAGQTAALRQLALLSACAPPALACHWLLFGSRCKCSSLLNVHFMACARQLSHKSSPAQRRHSMGDLQSILQSMLGFNIGKERHSLKDTQQYSVVCYCTSCYTDDARKCLPA